jgi:hypothetical protein
MRGGGGSGAVVTIGKLFSLVYFIFQDIWIIFLFFKINDFGVIKNITDLIIILYISLPLPFINIERTAYLGDVPTLKACNSSTELSIPLFILGRQLSGSEMTPILVMW